MKCIWLICSLLLLSLFLISYSSGSVLNVPKYGSQSDCAVPSADGNPDLTVYIGIQVGETSPVICLEDDVCRTFLFYYFDRKKESRHFEKFGQNACERRERRI